MQKQKKQPARSRAKFSVQRILFSARIILFIVILLGAVVTGILAITTGATSPSTVYSGLSTLIVGIATVIALYPIFFLAQADPPSAQRTQSGDANLVSVRLAATSPANPQIFFFNLPLRDPRRVLRA